MQRKSSLCLVLFLCTTLVQPPLDLKEASTRISFPSADGNQAWASSASKVEVNNLISEGYEYGADEAGEDSIVDSCSDFQITELEDEALKTHNHSDWLNYISNDATKMYYMWPGMDGLVSLYEATGNAEYIGYALAYAKRYRDQGTDVDGDGYLDWWSSWINDYSHWHVEWRAGAGVARVVGKALTDPKLNAYRADALALKDFIDQHIWDKWLSYAYAQDVKSAEGDVARFGIVAMNMYRITGEQKYADFINARGPEMFNSVAAAAVSSENGQDTSHIGDFVNFAVDAYQAGLVFSKADINQLVGILKDNIWDGQTNPPHFSDHLDGSDHPEYNQGIVQGSWIKLAEYDEELWDMYYPWVTTASDDGWDETDPWADDKHLLQVSANLARVFQHLCDSDQPPDGGDPTFIDVPLNHWAHDEIEALYQAGYVAGCSTDPLMYCPEATMTRAESAVFVERGIHGAGYFPADPAGKFFADVPLSEWFAKWATGLWEDGYTAGCGTDPLQFCPLRAHTRTEGTVFFLRMLNGSDYLPPPAVGLFTDVDTDFWGAKWIEAAYGAGLIPACATSPELRFCPDDPLDRAMGAYMMVQAKGLGGLP